MASVNPLKGIRAPPREKPVLGENDYQLSDRRTASSASSHAAKREETGYGHAATATMSLIKQIHRWDVGFTALCSKRDQWREHFCSAAELTEATLDNLNLLGTPDTYFSLNTFLTRKRRRLLFLNAVWVDLDPVDRTGQLDFWELAREIRVRQRQCYVPEFSFLVDSGRGGWGLILLTADDTTKPQVATPEAIQRQERINREMAARLSELGTGTVADRGVFDAVRVTRLPFSINSKTGRTVVYHPQHDANGRIPASTLATLSAFFRLGQTDTPTIATVITTPPATISTSEARRASNVDPQRSRWGRQGQRARFEKELAGLRSLERLRGGFVKYQRSNAMFAQSLLLRVLGHDQREIERQALALGSRCRPPLSQKKCLVMAAAPHTAKYSQFPWTRRRILRLLGVTVSEQSQIAEWKPRQKRCPANSEKRTLDRRTLELNAIQQHGPMSLSQMQAHVMALGYVASRETVSRDYAALGIVWRGKAGRRKKNEPLSLPPPPLPPTLGLRVDNYSCGRGTKFALPPARVSRGWVFHVQARERHTEGGSTSRM